MRRFTIGRSRQNDIVVEDASVSRRHAELRELGAGRYKLVDLGSTHGTHVDRGGLWEKLSVAEVTRGNRVRFGNYTRSVDSLLDSALVVKPERGQRQSRSTTMIREPRPRAGAMTAAACLFVLVGIGAIAAYYFLPA